jgi:Zn-finger protein
MKDKEKESDAGFLILETAQMVDDTKKDKVWDAEKCRFLHITNDTREEIYRLAKPGEFWRIVSLNESYVSINSKIKGLHRLEKSNKPRTTLPSEKQKKEIRDAIKVLKKYSNNENKER